MNYIPIFTKLQDRPVLVVGGKYLAAKKVNMLLCAGAKIKIVAKNISIELDQLYQEGQIHFIGKNFTQNSCIEYI